MITYRTSDGEFDGLWNYAAGFKSLICMHCKNPSGAHYWNSGQCLPRYSDVEAYFECETVKPAKVKQPQPVAQLQNPCPTCGIKEIRPKSSYCSTECWKTGAGKRYTASRSAKECGPSRTEIVSKINAEPQPTTAVICCQENW